MTEEEKRELHDRLTIDYMGNPIDRVFDWVEQKKKEWQEIAVAEYKLKKEMETKFYSSGLPGVLIPSDIEVR